MLWLFATGWAAARAERWWQRAVVTAVVLLCVPGFFGDPQRDAVIATGVLLLLWVPRLPVPAPLVPLTATLAGASLFVYLTHWQVYGWVRPVDPWLAVLASLVVGVLWARAGGAMTAAAERGVGQLAGAPPAGRRPAPSPTPRADDVGDGVGHAPGALGQQPVLNHLADDRVGEQGERHGQDAAARPRRRREGHRGEDHDVDEQVQAGDAAADVRRARPVEDGELDQDDGDRHEPPGALVRSRHAVSAPPARTALRTASATTVVTSGWKTLGTM